MLKAPVPNWDSTQSIFPPRVRWASPACWIAVFERDNQTWWSHHSRRLLREFLYQTSVRDHVGSLGIRRCDNFYRCGLLSSNWNIWPGTLVILDYLGWTCTWQEGCLCQQLGFAWTENGLAVGHYNCPLLVGMCRKPIKKSVQLHEPRLPWMRLRLYGRLELLLYSSWERSSRWNWWRKQKSRLESNSARMWNRDKSTWVLRHCQKPHRQNQCTLALQWRHQGMYRSFGQSFSELSCGQWNTFAALSPIRRRL